jgi:hypothetical protein
MHERDEGVLLDGTAVFLDSGRPVRLDYRVWCDRDWRTRTARVVGWIGTGEVEIDISVDTAGTWRSNGAVYAAVMGCEDVDLSFTPATNVLPIRRSRLVVGTRVAVRAAWLRFPEFTLETLDQTYERVGATQYKYASRGGAFTAMLDTNDVGLVRNYPGLWQVEA